MWPITYDDVQAARRVVEPVLARTPVRQYVGLDAWIGGGVTAWIKHENHQPTGAFKVRNGLAALARLDPAARARGVIAATRGNHGQGVAWAGRQLGVPVVICVPEGNSPSKNRAMRDLGAELIISGRDYDESVEVAERLVAERGLTMVHSTNDAGVIAGAATITDELFDQLDGVELDAMVVAVGGGSQAVGALAVVRARRPDVEVYAVQAAGAAAIHDGWHAGEPRRTESAETFADGLATRACYPLTFGALREGLAGFVTATDDEIGEAICAYIDRASTLAEGAGAAALAGARNLARGPLSGKRIGVILSGGNIDIDVLAGVLTRCRSPEPDRA